jgi:hypothetical protein
VALAALTRAAAANCYDVNGCTDRNLFKLRVLLDGPTCEFLYEVRNGIYQQHGYCFHTPLAIATFGNALCATDDASELHLNAIERANATTILRAEQTLGCRE